MAFLPGPLLVIFLVITQHFVSNVIAANSTCLTPEKVYYYEPNGYLAVGDCLGLVNSSLAKEFASKKSGVDPPSTSFYLNSELAKDIHTIGVFQPVYTKKCKGLELTELAIQEPTTTKNDCPSGQIPIQPQAKAKKVNACTRAYGTKADKLAGTDTWEEDAGLCYPKCESRKGFKTKGVGPVCWQKSCPDDMKDNGALCLKHTYGRGSGYATKKSCKKHKGKKTGCQTWGLLWYPKCRSGYKHSACCLCEEKCPSGMKDTGVDCAKISYGRGVGKTPPTTPTWEIVVTVAATVAVAGIVLAVAGPAGAEVDAELVADVSSEVYAEVDTSTFGKTLLRAMDLGIEEVAQPTGLINAVPPYVVTEWDVAPNVDLTMGLLEDYKFGTQAEEAEYSVRAITLAKDTI